MALNGRPIALGLDGWWDRPGTGLYTNGAWRKLVERRVIENGRRHVLQLQVGAGGLRVILDGLLLFAHPEFASLSMPAHVDIPDGNAGFVIGAVRSRFVLHAVRLFPGPAGL